MHYTKLSHQLLFQNNKLSNIDQEILFEFLKYVVITSRH